MSRMRSHTLREGRHTCEQMNEKVFSFSELTVSHWIDLTLKGLHTPFCSPTCNISVTLQVLHSFHPFYSHSPPPLHKAHSFFFSLTVRRYLKDQITMATISHIVIAHTRVWRLFLFWRVCRCTRTSLAVCQVTCSGDEGTMLPSVGSVCLHTVTDSEKHPAPPVMTHDSQSHAN